ncbi:MAG: insulinase family protein [Erysipelotrichaceae bacterium]|nr:insulinase family protein [Erysipelotrichaceae bacterium]
MKVNDVIHGFKVINVRHSDEIKADMYEMVHEKTNARTIWLKRDDENKTFSIGFKTTPVDDTGVFHILEHSVLNGSKRYPVREPFVDLLKGSLQTFLNAMTYPDKTVYPVSSRNDKDFINLMRVYLDAVFNPLVLQNPNVFYQEGWHYELNDEKADPIYKGVVFNEMKGAFSSADGVRSRYMMHSLFPDNCYGNESGGDPEYITSLTYEQFCDAHRKYYNPSNSYIFLDGDLDIEKVLGIIDDEYLSNYGKEGDLISIEKQKPVVAMDQTIEYEISAESDPKGKAQVAYGYVLSDFDDFEKTVGMTMIASVLCSSNESKLKKAILEKGLGEDVSFDVQDGIYQPFCEIDVINTDLEKEAEITRTITDVFNDVVKEGVDRKELEAAINQKEFNIKERDYGRMPKGLIFGLSCLDTWLYGGDPMEGVCADKLFASLREKLDTSFYEDLIRDYILDSKHCAKIMLKPSNTLGEQKAKHEKEKLEKISSGWSIEERKELVELNRRLTKWQNTPDSPEQKASLPMLHLEDLKKTPTKFRYEVSKYNGNAVISHDVDTNGISYTSIYSEVNDFELQEYTVMTQLLAMLGQLRTEKYDVLTLNREMKSILGSFDATLSPISSYRDSAQRNSVCLSFCSLKRNDEAAMELVKEIIYKTDFSDKEAIKKIIKQNLFGLEQMFISAGHALALQRCLAYTSPVAVISEYMAGYEAYRYLKDLDDNFEKKADAFIEKMKELYKKIFIKERYTISVAGDDQEKIIRKMIDEAPSGQIGEETEKEPLGHRREGIIVASNVSYAVKSNYMKRDIENLGIMYVIGNILSYDYLWNNIRVKGGAYGCGFRCGYAGTMSFYSYRDPDPKNSLAIYADTVDYFRNFLKDTQSIENYIVGTTGEYDPYQSIKSAIRTATAEYLNGIDYETKKKTLEQILNASKEDIEKTFRLFDSFNKADNICVIGNKQALENCRESLDVIFDLNQK